MDSIIYYRYLICFSIKLKNNVHVQEIVKWIKIQILVQSLLLSSCAVQSAAPLAWRTWFLLWIRKRARAAFCVVFKKLLVNLQVGCIAKLPDVGALWIHGLLYDFPFTVTTLWLEWLSTVVYSWMFMIVECNVCQVVAEIAGEIRLELSSRAERRSFSRNPPAPAIEQPPQTL